MWLAWGDLTEIGEGHSLNQKLLHLSSLLFLMQLPCSGRPGHVGIDASNVAQFCLNTATVAASDSYHCLSGLNHIGVVVSNLDTDVVEAKRKKPVLF